MEIPDGNDEAGQAKYQRETHFVKLTRKIRSIKTSDKGLHDTLTAAAQAQVAFLQEKIKQIMDEQGVFTDLRHQYIAYAEALAKSQDQMDFMVDLRREWRILRHRFEARGLDPVVLQAIDHRVIYRTRDR